MDVFKMILFICCLLSMPITAFIMGQVWLGIVFCVFYTIFGVIEVMAKKMSGKTVTQHVRTLSMKKRWIVIGSMIIGWASLIIHFLGAI